uniref:DUF262 domain-containing protein n=1 Tax=Candidatus Kentrum eta TaxID=2126337 RepID=A0A450V9Y6_9GAMM|nr:MAG: Protein of unknown function (DUF1524) [Candidatus Kentron sp. H]VFJ95342.1 MAG: Protein of unknown function (DUF1524) [Candidatus Kentron sp. H]VFK01591.1 MAG: Protein of unknown function (DUF1524) [Candidatus Kentron sp. H]
MPKSILLDTHTNNFLELIGNSRIYRVPPYQRDYSWTMEQWEDLWKDILEIYEDRNEYHYMGALVIQTLSDREFFIIDGQQRMATLSTLALAVLGQLQRLAKRGIDPAANRERAAGLRNRFIGEKDPASLVESSKLFLNRTDDGFYQDYLVQSREPRNPRGLPKSNKLIWNCFQYFSNRIESVEDFRKEGGSVAALLNETVARQLLFIVISVDDQLNAYTVFETLNARGLELSATDLLKNYLFSQVKTQADLDALQRRWHRLIHTVRQERFPEFLRYHLLCDYKQVRRQRLFKMVQKAVKSPEAVFSLMAVLESRADLFSALSDPGHEYWMEHKECLPYIREINLFGVRQMTPLLFVAWEGLSGEDFVRVLKLVSIISFRYIIVCALNPNVLEPAYHAAAKALSDGTAKRPVDLFERLRPVYVTDEKFRQDFAMLDLDTTHHRRKKIAKYILTRLESEASGRDCDFETDPGSIEHILPENPTETWEEHFPERRWEGAVYRLGNLTLLESGANRRIGNAEYPEKSREYEKSGYHLTRHIPEIAPERWSSELLDLRQSRLAHRAVHIWRADFS